MTEHKVNFFFVGFPKSGSTTFYYLLKSHPEIFAPSIKELNYFNSDHNREFKKHLGDNYFQLASSEEEYSRFSQGGEDKIKGDFNPIYIFSEEAPENIYHYNPAAKILISVREPVSFLRSFHFQSLYNMIEDEPDFLKALQLEESRRLGQNIPEYCHNPFYLFYTSLVTYKRHIKRYTDIFGFDNVKIILFDDILRDEYTLYQEVLHFLKIKDIEFIPPKVDINSSHALRFARLRQFVFTPPIKKWLYTKTPQKLLPVGAMISQRLFKKAQEKPFVSKTDVQQLKLRFRSNVDDLSSFLSETNLMNRDLADLWDY